MSVYFQRGFFSRAAPEAIALTEIGGVPFRLLPAADVFSGSKIHLFLPLGIPAAKGSPRFAAADLETGLKRGAFPIRRMGERNRIRRRRVCSFYAQARQHAWTGKAKQPGLNCIHAASRKEGGLGRGGSAVFRAGVKGLEIRPASSSSLVKEMLNLIVPQFAPRRT